MYEIFRNDIINKKYLNLDFMIQFIIIKVDILICCK